MRPRPVAGRTFQVVYKRKRVIHAPRAVCRPSLARAELPDLSELILYGQG
jgi:hypothetical protein